MHFGIAAAVERLRLNRARRRFYSQVWFNTPRLAAAQKKQNNGVFGIEPDIK